MRFLLQFRGIHNDLRLGEFYSVLSMIRKTPEESLRSSVALVPAYSRLTKQFVPANPTRGHAGAVLYGEIFYYAELQGESEAREVAARTVLLKTVYKPVAHGSTFDHCLRDVGKGPDNPALAALYDSESRPTFKCKVEAFGRSIPYTAQIDCIHQFTELLKTFPGTIRMKVPDHELSIVIDAFPVEGHGNEPGADTDTATVTAKHTDINARTKTDTHADVVPVTAATLRTRQVFLALRVAGGQAHLKEAFSLKRRRYIGPTSMDSELAFVMCNMAQVRTGDLAVDPFCGTCSTLVAAAALGAHTIGADINILALRGKGRRRTIADNFEQYGLSTPLGTVRSDVANSPFVSTVFDAVVCDPPYGIKEGTRVFRKDVVEDGMQLNHFQGTRRIRYDEFLKAILSFAAHSLRPGGRLVYWLPTTTAEYSDDDVPTHPKLKLVHNGVQPLTVRMSRRLITMRRLSRAEEVEAEAAREAQAKEEKAQKPEQGNEVQNGKTPSYFDLARKMMRQPERSESLLPKSGTSK